MVCVVCALLQAETLLEAFAADNTQLQEQLKEMRGGTKDEKKKLALAKRQKVCVLCCAVLCAVCMHV